MTISASNNAEIGATASFTATAGTDNDTCEVTVVDSPKRGDYIILNSRAITGVGPANTDNTSNTSNEDDWMILYNGLDETEDDDKKGLFVIMSNYLPNAYKANDNDIDGVAKKAGLSYATGNYETYGICTSNWPNFEKMLMPKDETDSIQITASAAWKSLISSDIITAYSKTKVYGAIDKDTMDKIKGYSNYYPWNTGYQNCYGYWIASPYPNSPGRFYTIKYIDAGYQNQNCTSSSSTTGILPIVILPQDVQLEKNSSGVWKVVTSNNT